MRLRDSTPKTRVAFGIAEGAKSLERNLQWRHGGCIPESRAIPAANPDFAAARGNSVALRRDLGKAIGLTLSAETGEVYRERRVDEQNLPYRLSTVSVDKQLGSRNWLSWGVTRLDEQRSLLGGRMGDTFGAGGGAKSWFVDGEARHDFGGDISAILSARRGWTSFAGGRFQTSAYAFDLAMLGLLSESDRLGLRLSQPIRIEQGGLLLVLPTGL